MIAWVYTCLRDDDIPKDIARLLNDAKDIYIKKIEIQKPNETSFIWLHEISLSSTYLKAWAVMKISCGFTIRYDHIRKRLCLGLVEVQSDKPNAIKRLLRKVANAPQYWESDY